MSQEMFTLSSVVSVCRAGFGSRLCLVVLRSFPASVSCSVRLCLISSCRLSSRVMSSFCCFCLLLLPLQQLEDCRSRRGFGVSSSGFSRTLTLSPSISIGSYVASRLLMSRPSASDPPPLPPICCVALPVCTCS